MNAIMSHESIFALIRKLHKKYGKAHSDYIGKINFFKLSGNIRIVCFNSLKMYIYQECLFIYLLFHVVLSGQ